jgi:hypothetical protein
MDKQQTGGIDFADVAFSEQFSTPHPSDMPDADGEPSKLLAELLWVLHAEPNELKQLIRLLNRIVLFYDNSPRGFDIVLTKVLHPEMSYQDIATEQNTSKQLVAYHLKRANEVLPELESAVLVDRRHHPKLNYAKTCTVRRKSRTVNGPQGKLWQYIDDNYDSILDFSKKIGIEYSVVYRTAHNQRKPRLETRKKFARALGVTLEQLNEQYGL